MNSKPLLTIAIPTYNRPENLEKILIQLEKQPNEKLVILISDDNSPDNGETRRVVTKYQRSMPNLVFNRNEKNLGFSGHVCKLYELAETRYIWFFCDDDTLLPNAVDNMISSLRKHEPVVAVFNCIWVDPLGRKSVAGPDKDIVYENPEDLEDYQILMRMTFLSTLVVERRISLDDIKKTDYTDNVFFQITLGLALLSDKFRFCEIAFPILHRNVGYKYGEFFKFSLVDHLRAIFAIKHNFDNRKFIKWSKKHLFTSFKLYLSQKLGLFIYEGKPTRKTIMEILKYYDVCSIFIFSFVILGFIIPKFLLRNLYLLKLYSIHGIRRGKEVYGNTIDRAYRDERKTGFTTYR